MEMEFYGLFGLVSCMLGNKFRTVSNRSRKECAFVLDSLALHCMMADSDTLILFKRHYCLLPEASNANLTQTAIEIKILPQAIDKV